MLETERLIFTPVSLADFEASYAMFSDPSVVRFIGGKPATREQAWTKVLRNVGHWAAFGYGIFTVREKTSDAFVGEAGLALFNRGLGEQFDPYPEAAWVLTKESHGQGYATEAVLATHTWMASSRGVERTVCIIHPDNAGSIRVAEKMNYRPFGQANYRGAAPIMFERDRGAGEKTASIARRSMKEEQTARSDK